jgi:hypothetical protein
MLRPVTDAKIIIAICRGKCKGFCAGRRIFQKFLQKLEAKKGRKCKCFMAKAC